MRKRVTIIGALDSYDVPRDFVVKSLEVFKDWCGNVIRRCAYFVEHGHLWEHDKKDKKCRVARKRSSL